MRVGYVPGRDLEVAKKEAKDWETMYRESEEARVAAETRASETETALTTAVGRQRRSEAMERIS